MDWSSSSWEALPLPRFVIGEQAIVVVQHLARSYGARGAEVAVLLAGNVRQEQAVLDRIILPRQEAFRTEYGCGLIIEGGCLNRIGPRMREEGRRIHGILHSHPGDAFHSDTDDAATLMRFDGSFSVVVPDFGARSDLLDGSMAYIFNLDTGWNETPATKLIGVRRDLPCEVIHDE